MLFKSLAVALAGLTASSQAVPQANGPASIPRDVLTLIPAGTWGPNPTGLELHLHAPSTLHGKPAIILALHTCFGTGPMFHDFTLGYPAAASAKNYVVLYPTSLRDNNCWDVANNASLIRDGGGDSTGLATIVRWAITTFNANPEKVFLTGSSSGCMMSNVMAATYPDLFAAISCYSGVPAGCMAGSPGYSPITADPSCADGLIRHTPEEWADIVRDMAPLPKGKGKKSKDNGWKYPRFQTWHGDNDFFVNYFHNFAEQLEQWSEIHEVGFSHNVTATPLPGYTKMVYGDGTKVLGYSVSGVGHVVPQQEASDLEWFGL
ncbi:family 1 putative carbohydrate esterase [Podospora fimiseda]|uniref:Family 1 putative carbohydrate esterase n=1 Tax=Podospora fimiseda TaxID=252190 RepID=A0AAN6YJZ9_9PEZI|nr:family 1 putative carbohydrate esterase [Podospora fimiseda]